MVLLVIDEAQNLSLGALEELRMLSNLETEKSKLMQIVLVGQPNLRDKMSAPELEQLRQRITVSYHLNPLDAGETANYINHRLRRAAIGAPLEFPREVTDVIHARSRGVPRIINVICDAALVFGYAEERRQVDATLMDDVLSELELTGVLPPETAAAPAPATAEGRPEPAVAGAAMGAVPSSIQLEELRRAERTTQAAMEQAARRAAEIDRREEAVRNRERELAEQRRILAEEYRLLRVQRAAAAPAAPMAAGVGRPVRPAPEPFTDSRQGLWSWLKRVANGGSDSALEGR
jgi:general secretion pathway protein A